MKDYLKNCVHVGAVLRQVAASESFRYSVERRHLTTAADAIDVLQDEIFKLKRFCNKLIDNAEDIASGRFDSQLKEISEFIEREG